MRKFFALLAVVLLLASTATAFAKLTPNNASQAMRNGELSSDVPARAPDGFARTDTLDFGYYTTIGGQYYAVLGQTWTWDHGAANVYEGWYAVDQTANIGDFFRQITTTSWSGHQNQVAAPIINGAGSVWVGIFEDQARTLCWEAGLGYGNQWCQRLTSREYTWTGAGNVNLSFTYFNNSEADFDYSKVLLSAGPTPVGLNGDGFTDIIGTPPTGPWASFSHAITAAEFGVPANSPFRIYFEFTSDGGWSDEDGDWPTDYGPFGMDDLSLTGAIADGSHTYNFDAGLGADWTAGRCPGIGSYFSIQPLSQYIIQDPCQCKLLGHVAAFHDENFKHKTGQLVSAWSPPADRTNYQSYNKIIAEWDQYAEMPQNAGVFYRPGWSYYPYLCPSTGQYMWSNRRGQTVWHYVGDQPVCYTTNNVGTDWGVPADAQDVGFVYEVYSSCDAFGIPSTVCLGYNQTNFTPVIDNVRIRMTGVVNAPAANLDTGDKFVDGFPQTANLGVLSTGLAKVGRPNNTSPGGANPYIEGDSLVIVGPTVTPSTRWESKLWFRVKREGPGQIHIANYRTWKNRVADGKQIVGAQGQYTWGWMDSVEVGAQVAKNKFDSYFRENDDDYTPGAGPKPDVGPQNKIIMDNILTPGSKIEYFCTTNYTCLPTTYFYIPDTTGAFTYEFEILPSYRTDTQQPVPPGYGPYRFPCILYVDAYDRGVQTWMEGALNMALNGASVTNAFHIPDPTKWDRYDYNDAASNYHVPVFRGVAPSNNGATTAELLGYKMIIWNTGLFSPDGGTCSLEDFTGLADWLSNPTCSGNVNPQAFWGGGDDFSGVVTALYPSFLNDYCGTTANCSKYYDPSCPNPDPDNDQNYCVRLETVGTGWTNTIPLDVYGNWCPQQYSYDVLGTAGTGQGQKSYRKVGGGLTNYSQVRNDQLASANKYRTVVDGYSFNHMIQRIGNDPGTECTFDTTNVLNATFDEFKGLARWAMNLGSGYDLTTFGLCIDPCLDPLAAPDQPTPMGAVLVNRLEQNSPNPFNPSTSIRFSLAQTGPAKISIYDVNGRLVKTLVDGQLSAGPHVAVWDGMDQMGHKVSAGIYWSQLSTNGFSSNKKMVVVR